MMLRHSCCLQELSGADKEDAGGVPRTLEVELKGDLVDCCSAGDVVTVLGLVKVATSEARKGGCPSSHRCTGAVCKHKQLPCWLVGLPERPRH